MAHLITPPVRPMLAKLQSEIPVGREWLYEPKWDGFRAIVFRDGDRVDIGSRTGQPLARYFPELVEIFRTELPERCVIDGEILLAVDGKLDFEALQLRLHPAASRVRMLAERSPASFAAFDVLALGEEDVRPRPFRERRASLIGAVDASARCFPTPQTSDPTEAREWFERFEGAGLDGIIAKHADGPYVEGERVMVKVKHERTADCVVGGYRVHKSGKGVGSLLLGLYRDGVLHHVGFTAAFTAKDRVRIAELLKPLEGGRSFTGEYGPGGPSRWSRDKDLSWISLEPRLVCEVAFDHLQGEHRFRHGAKFLRWRADKRPEECTFSQLDTPHPFSFDDVVELARRRS